MSINDSSLHLLVPGLLGPMPALAEKDPLPSLPGLETLLARSERSEFPGRDLESTMMALYGWKGSPEVDLPLGALSRAGEGATPDQRYWLMVEPVLLRPDQDRLLLFDTRDFEFSVDEARQLGELFKTHFQDQEWKLEIDDAHRWYLSPSEEPGLSTRNLGDAFGRNMDMFLPTGSDSIFWRSLINEVQMLFYECPVNQKREAEGRLPVSGVWFSGGGYLPAEVPRVFNRIVADHPLARGLAIRSGAETSLLTRDWSLPGETAGGVLAVYSHLKRPVWRADPYDWLDALASFESWLQGLLASLRKRQLDDLYLYPCNNSVYRLTPSGIRKFWKRPRPFAGRLDQHA
ncbi:MAG: hypothetical protein GY703_00215 [Gammaproteobacteria bacterium]|nr:hypothetical protein [Gammaproteobacteria bacterium]